ncbi:hypothetical protein QR680_014119 [Steinernema hermaphroditum]|uniref:EGF-like domain-containing protein n=1 Tax=Steinernema hermaphroditum TaxID=289476 RepID=A0AA39M3C4_9BILA|nr:hypothetical protein QR680_014119 [Steinernema hermaphroditum]
MSFDPSFMNPNTDEQDIDRVFYLLHRYYEKNCRAVNETETFRSNEIDLAHLVVDFINKACFERDNAGDLTFGDDSPADVTVIDESSDTDADDYIPSQGETSNKKRMMEDFYNVETMHKIVEMAENHPFSAVQHRYRKIRDRSDIHICKKYIEHPTSLLRKQLKVELYTKFCEWNGEGHVIQDRDLRYEAYQIAAALGLTNFKASDSYIKRFKKHHRIVSRKITRMVAIKAVDRLHLITDNVERFRTDARSILSNMDHDKVYNTDQSGIQMELRSGRTLTFMGVKQVEVTCQRENALTHSVTIQPAISASGTLQLPMLLQPYQNLKCCHSTSGNMSSILFEEWVRNVYLPAAGEGSVLIIDSWSGMAICSLRCRHGGQCRILAGREDIQACACPSEWIGYLCQLENPYIVYYKYKVILILMTLGAIIVPLFLYGYRHREKIRENLKSVKSIVQEKKREWFLLENKEEEEEVSSVSTVSTAKDLLLDYSV